MELEDLTKDELKVLRAILYEHFLTKATIKEQEVIKKTLNIINDKIYQL